MARGHVTGREEGRNPLACCLGGPEWDGSPDRTNPLGGFVRAGAAPLAGCAARPPWWVVQAHGVLDAKARLFPNLGVTRTPAVEGDGRG